MSTCDSAATALRYTYDRVGNRLTQTQTGTGANTTTYGYDNADQLPTAAVTGGATTAYGYDADGNQTTAGTRTTTYTLDNQPATTTTGATPTTYGYDAAGNRIIATTGTATIGYRWDVNNPLPQLATSRNGTAAAQAYRYDPTGQPLSLATPALVRSYYATDWLGSVTDLTAANGTPRYAYTYQPFGDGPGADPPALATGSPANPLRYTGQYLDPTTAQYNLRARHYDPATGRLTGTDPIDPATGTPTTSPYAYTADRPTVATDPSGACWYIPFSGHSSCPGAGTLRATVGIAEGTYHVGAGIVTAVAHPVRTAHTIYDTCQAGVNEYGRILGPDIACGYAILGKPIVDQLVLAATTCAGTTDASTTSPKASSPSSSSAKAAAHSAPAPPPTPSPPTPQQQRAIRRSLGK